MPRKYTRMEFLSEEIFRRKANGETNLEIDASRSMSR